ncbi:MAG TPA: cupin domain-containing protein [Bacteroidales bacterium]|nr:cupin domain-containing protein [Bacteroidales bacterium]HRZ50185.1 cupin domain-containing protein [Bacteroidales bacterium]
MPEADNLYAGIPEKVLRDIEFTEILHHSQLVRIERIISTGQVSPEGFWYDQAEDEWVALLDGEAEIAFSDQPAIRLTRGDHLLIPAHCRHRVSFTSTNPPAVWLAVFIRKFAE